MKIQIRGFLIFTTERPHQKLLQHIVLFFHHGKRHIKKFRKNDKINCNIFFSRRQYLLHCVLIEEQQVTLLKNHPVSIHNMRGSPLAHIDHFHIIMPVFWEIYKTGVRSDLDQLPLFQKLLTVHDQFLLLRIKVLVDSLSSVQYHLFFFRDHRQFSDQFRMHTLTFSISVR